MEEKYFYFSKEKARYTYNEEIEKIAKIICDYYKWSCKDCPYRYTPFSACDSYSLAYDLYNGGCRKVIVQSEDKNADNF